MNVKPLFKLMVEKKASDLFFAPYAPAKIKIEGKIMPVNKLEMTPKMVKQAAIELMDDDQLEYFTKELEIDFAISEKGLGRFRVNIFHQRGNVGMVLRYITSELPDLNELGMPEQLKELVMLRRGLILMVGATGAGKSTTLAAMINFFPEERHKQLLMDLSLNAKAIVSQRLVPREGGIGRVAAMEILLNTPLIADLIFKGEGGQIKEIMSKSTRLGMQTFDQALYDLYESGAISYEEAMRNADSKNELRLRVKLESKRDSSIADQQSESLKIMDEDTAQTF